MLRPPYLAAVMRRAGMKRPNDTAMMRLIPSGSSFSSVSRYSTDHGIPYRKFIEVIEGV